MDIYFSGARNRAVNLYLASKPVCRLLSYAYPKDAYEHIELLDECNTNNKIIIDSGAFTAWSIGKPVVLESLIAYSNKLVTSFPERQFTFISLDVIPGSKQTPATSVDIKRGMEQSVVNYHEYQSAMGDLEVLPVYHSGEPTSFRDYFLNYTDHICLSMNQRLAEKDRVSWANRVQVDGVKLHGLAATGTQMVKKVNWYSVDSAGWLMVAAMGGIIMSTQDGRLVTLPISDRSPALKIKNTHYKTLSEHKAVKEYILSKGYNPETLASDDNQRMFWNTDVWLEHNWQNEPTIEEGFFND